MHVHVRLFTVVEVDDAVEESTAQQVHDFPADPFGAGTTFEWRGRRFVHYADVRTGPDSIDVLFMEEQRVVKLEEGTTQ